MTAMTAPHWLKWPVLFLFFLYPVVTLSVSNGGSGVYILVILLALAYAWPAWKTLADDEKRVLIGLLVFVVLSLFSMLNTDNQHEANKQLERFARFLMIVPAYMLVRRVNVPLGKVFLAGVVVGALVLGVEAWYQVHIEHRPLADGAYHKIVFGDTATLLAALLAAAMITLPMKSWQYAACIAAILAGLYASVLSLTRGAWLLIPVLAVGWLWMFRHRIARRGWIVIGIIAVFSVIVAVAWAPASIKQHMMRGVQNLETYQEDPSTPTSWGIRLNLWRDSITIFTEHPLLGAGLGDLSVARQDLAKRGLANKVYLEGNQAHSIYFQALATRGLVGLLALLVCVLILPLWYFYRRWPEAVTPWQNFYVLGGVTTILAFAMFGLSEGWLTRNPFLNTYAMFLVVFMSGTAANFSQPLAVPDEAPPAEAQTG